MFTDAQALLILNAIWGHSAHARHQALEWAALVAGANARHQFSNWTDAETDAVFYAGSNPDLIAALGHQTPAAYLDSDA